METYTRERQAQNQRVDHDRRDRITAVIRNAAAHHQIRLPNEVTEGIGAMMDGFELIDDIPMPVLMDYAATGFAMGPGGRPQSPPYIEPSPAPEGFIKSTEEDDIVICPNCNDELGVGKDELKRQVWIAKACGHVYCGECAKNRAVKRGPKTAKVALRTKPFSKCVVEDCVKSVSQQKAMVPLYL